MLLTSSHIGCKSLATRHHIMPTPHAGVAGARRPAPANRAAHHMVQMHLQRPAATASASSAAASAPPDAPSAVAAAAALRLLGKAQGALCMPQLGLGLAALGRPGYINLGHSADLASGKDVEQMRQHCWQVLDEAWACGVRYFDAARSYGRAEEFLGGWLAVRGIAPQEVVVGSKWGYVYTANWQVDTQGQPHEVKEHTAANLMKQAAETDQNLGPFLDLYQIHSATLESGVLGAADVLAALAQLKAEKGWAIGLSVSGADLLAAHQAGLSVIIKEAMANGRLTTRNAEPAFASRLALLQETAQQYDTTVDALALACVLQQPYHPMVLSGASCKEQLRSNFAAVELAEELPQEVVLQLAQQLVQPPQDYWGQRSQLAWN